MDTIYIVKYRADVNKIPAGIGYPISSFFGIVNFV